MPYAKILWPHYLSSGHRLPKNKFDNAITSINSCTPLILCTDLELGLNGQLVSCVDNKQIMFCWLNQRAGTSSYEDIRFFEREMKNFRRKSELLFLEESLSQ